MKRSLVKPIALGMGLISTLHFGISVLLTMIARQHLTQSDYWFNKAMEMTTRTQRERAP